MWRWHKLLKLSWNGNLQSRLVQDEVTNRPETLTRLLSEQCRRADHGKCELRGTKSDQHNKPIRRALITETRRWKLSMGTASTYRRLSLHVRTEEITYLKRDKNATLVTQKGHIKMNEWRQVQSSWRSHKKAISITDPMQSCMHTVRRSTRYGRMNRECHC
jgi:hypothetical protein